VSRASRVTACLGVGALALAACRTAPGSDRLEGRWIGVRAEGPGAENVPAANAFASGVELEFHRNEIFITAAHQAQAGRYAVVKEDPSSVVITTDHDGPAHPQTFVFHGTEMMRWTVLEGRDIVFARE
jgi:hypothetical protein